MKTVVEPLEGNKVKLSVEVDEAEFEKAVDAAFRKIAREARIPGFRPGKAPRKLLEARIGLESARQEALRDALPEYYAQALMESEVDAIAPPEIDITAGEDSGLVAFDAVVEIRPQVSIPGYQGLQVTLPSPEVNDEDIERQIDRLRAQSGELVVVERPAIDGDFVTIDIKGTHEGEPVPGLTADDYLYEVGTGTVVPELDDQLRGSKIGDILAFDAEVPDNEPLKVQVMVKEVKERKLPEATDEWAQEASEFDTLAELQDDLRERLGGVKKVQTQLALRDEAVKVLADLVVDDPPEPLIQAEVERAINDLAHRLSHQNASLEQYLQATGQEPQAFVDSLRDGAIPAVKADLALRALADAEAIEASDEELDERIAHIASEANMKPADARRELDRNGQVPAVRSDIRKTKALRWLIDNVSIVDEEGHPIDRAVLEPSPAASEDPLEVEMDGEA